jgi:hypothetical protein
MPASTPFAHLQQPVVTVGSGPTEVRVSCAVHAVCLCAVCLCTLGAVCEGLAQEPRGLRSDVNTDILQHCSRQQAPVWLCGVLSAVSTAAGAVQLGCGLQHPIALTTHTSRGVDCMGELLCVCICCITYNWDAWPDLLVDSAATPVCAAPV